MKLRKMTQKEIDNFEMIDGYRQFPTGEKHEKHEKRLKKTK